MVRFLQTSDWQLGMARHFFSEGVQERFAQARFDAIRAMCRIAHDEKCDFIVVAGDVFESNMVDRKTVGRAIEALRDATVPVYLLPGNHDPLDASSVYLKKVFTSQKPGNVLVLERQGPVAAAPGVEILGVPWLSKRADRDMVAEALSMLEPAPGVLRVAVCHGVLDVLDPGRQDRSAISLSMVEQALQDGRIHYMALGDRHSCHEAGGTGRVFYSGTPEPTAYREEDPGLCLIVELSASGCRVQRRRVSSWAFIERERVDLNRLEDVEALEQWFDGLENKERTAVKLRFAGTLTITGKSRLDLALERAADLVAALETRDKDLCVIPDDADFAGLDLSGFAAAAVSKLREEAREQSEAGRVARDALSLLIRLDREKT